ncbi:hypothetical protein APHAL10511_001486 [Amanita phalloides]|nr:hypothetical protein APHAL10511_001486 [Amanita phalloides]
MQRPALRALLIDVSGTLQVGASPTPGAVQALKELRLAGIPFRLCSNTSKESTQSLLARMKAQGFDIRDEEQGIKELWTSIGAVKQALKQLGRSRPYLLLSPSAREELVDVPPEDDEMANYDSVVVGLAPSIFTYGNLNAAFRVLVGEGRDRFIGATEGNNLSGHRPNISLIATNKARYIHDGRLSLGAGPFVAALEYAAGIQAHIVGKPTKSFFEMVIDDLGNAANSREGVIAIIGDDVESDLGEGALELGLWRVLVRTGKYRQGDETRQGVAPPDEICDSFSSFIHSLLHQKKKNPAVRGKIKTANQFHLIESPPNLMD